MRIGYEAKRAFLNTTGLGNYSRGVIKMMTLYYPHNIYFLYTPKTRPGKVNNFTTPLPATTTVTPTSKLFTALWRSIFVVKNLKRDGIELYHGLSHELPLGIHHSGIKSVVTIHDLIFMRFPQYFDFVSRKIYAAKIKYACKHADKIIAISEKTKADLIELLKVNPTKIETVYQDCDESFKVVQSPEKKNEIKLKYALPLNFLLTIGTIEERKNLLLAVKALTLLPINIQLVVVGKDTAYADEVKQYIKQHQLYHRVLFLSDVAFADLPAIYQLAQVFVYPSRYEGFGIPVLEALVSGTPVIAASGSCLEEAGGPDSLYVEPDDENDLARKINLILTDKVLRQTMVDKGLNYARKFDNKNLATQLLNLYKNVLNHA
ncbi:glycosyltransferase involved in cell wall biosynthesis [Mucilaginibacter gracilis]|uniref:Glycosyltransferase involved in cell wall biosynthesis n=1 Tax=Mucilaginibacter gracilis TaxID=423350 RepID=A0A495J0J0_9SPHI|nr:glycosyltransferase family 1 protein [Mucilaginibacter gracilis]RKR82273.1 glycosyltransferase involved in cell wall biosynthesis [Mucilaginibacter gracilis]